MAFYVLLEHVSEMQSPIAERFRTLLYLVFFLVHVCNEQGFLVTLVHVYKDWLCYCDAALLFDHRF